LTMQVIPALAIRVSVLIGWYSNSTSTVHPTS
jgi:hypothetical protein